MEAIIKGGKQLVSTFKYGSSILNLEVEWTRIEDDKAPGNSKALNSILIVWTRTCLD